MNSNSMTIEQQYNNANMKAYAAWVEWQVALCDGHNAMTIALLKAVAVMLGKEAQRLERCLPKTN